MTALSTPQQPLPQWLVDAVMGLVGAAYEAGRADVLGSAERDEPEVGGSLTRTEAAAVLRISKTSVDNLIRSGALASYTAGTRRLIPRSAVDAYMAGETKRDIPTPAASLAARGLIGGEVNS